MQDNNDRKHDNYPDIIERLIQSANEKKEDLMENKERRSGQQRRGKSRWYVVVGMVDGKESKWITNTQSREEAFQTADDFIKGLELCQETGCVSVSETIQRMERLSSGRIWKIK